MGTKCADDVLLLQAARMAELVNHGRDDYDSHLHVVSSVYHAYLRAAPESGVKIFGGLSERTRKLAWALSTYFGAEARREAGLQPQAALLFWDHILTLGTHSFLVITRTHVVHRADYDNFQDAWLVRLEDIEGIDYADHNYGLDGNRRRLQLAGGRASVMLAAALGPWLHEVVHTLARLVRLCGRG